MSVQQLAHGYDAGNDADMLLYRLVSEECYPYTSGQTDVAGECLLRRRPSIEASVDCPRPPPTTSRLYQATPPYRISPSVRSTAFHKECSVVKLSFDKDRFDLKRTRVNRLQ